MIEDFKRAMAEKDIPEARRIARETLGRSGSSLESTVRRTVREMRMARIDDEPTLPELVELVDRYRAAGDEDSRLHVELLIQARHGPQKISGIASITRR